MKQLKIARNERGAVSVLFALLLFSLFAIAGIVVDLGFARSTQAMMQIAADGSAITGLRLRDDDSINENDRRAAVAINAARNFSHQVQGDTVSFPDDDRVFGAGPNLELDNGIGAERASQLITVPADTMYLPELELNLDNDEHGDMVSGDYDLNAIHTVGALDDPAHDENQDYERTGFTPDAAAPFEGDAFLVRLRRTPDALGLDNQAGVSSAGTPLPFLFARGAAIKHDESYDVGVDGLTVRATAIAMAQPAKSVGRSVAGIRGVTPFILSRDFWDGLILPDGDESLDFTLSVEADGRVINTALGVQVGRFIFDDSDNAETISIGMVPGAAVAPADISAVTVDGYVPIADFLGTDELMIGFGRAQMTLNDADGLAPYDVILTKFSSRVADANASASVHDGFVGLDLAVIEFLVDSNQTEGERFSDPLLAPALVR